MVNYGNGKIYKLVNDIDDKIYIGSTVQPLRLRLKGHISDAKKYTHFKVYEHINNMGWEHVNIILIENYECMNKTELLKKEREWYDKLNPQLNMFRPHTTSEEKKIFKITYDKNYRINNIDKLKEYITKYETTHKARLQKYRSEYRQQNAQKIKEKKKAYGQIRIMCECGTLVRKATHKRHRRSKKHLNLMESLQ